MKLNVKFICLAFILCAFMMVCSHTNAALIFQFDNTSAPEVDFVGVESQGVSVHFRSEKLNVTETFDLMNGATSKRNKFSPVLNVSYNLNNISRFGFGGSLILTPLTDVTHIQKSESFHMSDVTAYFINNGEEASFYDVAKRLEESTSVPEFTSMMLLLLCLVFMWSLMICNINHNA